MTFTVGNKLPHADFQSLGADGPESHAMADLTTGKKIVIFAVPGAYTGICSTAHMPSFIRTADAIRAKGVDAIYCLSVNDIFVMNAWAKELGADIADIKMLSDSDGSYTKAIGFDFTALPVGLINRSNRYSMIIDDGVITTLNQEAGPGVCELTAGETLLEQL